MIHDEVFENIWQNQTDGWIEYVKNDVLCTTFGYSRSSK